MGKLTNNEPTEKLFYKIRDVSEILGIPQSTLRFWESQFTELSPRRSQSGQRRPGQRYYTPEDLKTLEIIRFLVKERGMKIEAARQQMALNRKNVTRRLEIIRNLKEIRNDLQGLLSALEKRR